MYSAETIKKAIEPDYDRFFQKLAIGQPPNWKCDQRAKDLFCLAQWLMEELIRLQANDLDRKDVQATFNRKSRAENDLYELLSKLLNDYLEGKIERYRGR